jgi:hypothetical protein
MKVEKFLPKRGTANRLVRFGAALAVGLVGVELSASVAHAGYNSLALPYYGQTESEWCAIASAEMLLAYYGSSVQQCEMANYDFGRTDCCSNPSSSTCNPSSGSFTGKPIAYYGLSYSQYPNNSFSYAQFKSEIDAGRPVSIGYTWNSGGGHAMNVAGYYDTPTTQYLEVWDPLPSAGCPAGEDTCWITYATYIGGPSYNHVAQSPLYNIKSSPVCSSDYFDIPGSEMQQCFDTWTHKGRQPAALTATMIGGGVYYSGSYQPSTGAGWYQYTGLSPSDYQTKFNTLASQGYRPAQVSVVETYGGWIINAIWQPTEGTFYSYTGLSQATFNSYQSWFANNGYVIVDLFGYNDFNNNPQFAATWVKTTSQGQFPIIGTAAANYQSLFNAETGAGRRPTRVSAYDNGGTIEYATIWQNGGVGFYSDNGWSESSFAYDDSVHTAAGLKLSYVSALNNVFSGVWTQ